MHKITLVIFLLLLQPSCFSQDYVAVYRYGLLGAMHGEHGHPDSAENYLIKALDVIPDKTRFPGYFTLLKIADNHKDTKKIARYLWELSCVYPKDTLYRLLRDFGEISIDTLTFNSLFHPKCSLTEPKKFASLHPQAVDSIIASLRDRDQGIRTKGHELRKKGTLTEEEMTAFEREMREVDSANFLILYDCIRKYGVPCLDYPLNGSRVTQIMHIDNYEHFKKIDGYLLKAIKEGCFSPKDYAYALDRSLVASRMTPKYYWFLAGSEEAEHYKPGEKETLNVNRERKLIGLPPYPVWIGWAF